MYHWIEDKEFLSKMHTVCSDTVNQLVQLINKEGLLRVRAYMVGSGAKNLIVQNSNNPVDLDYNLEIVDAVEIDIDDGRSLKNYVKEKFDEILVKTGWGHCQDSTSALTTVCRGCERGNRTLFSIDLCIIERDQNGWYRLIHKKTGNTRTDEYYWNQAPESNGLDKRIEWLKRRGLWLEVRDTYLKKKNMYLQRPFDHDHPSFVVYIETVNEVYYKYCH